MTNILHATLSSSQHRRLYALRHDPARKPRQRDRVEVLLLSADGMRVSRLARHFGCCQATMRRGLHQSADKRLQSLCHLRRDLGPDAARRPTVRRTLNRLSSRKRTWTVAQLAGALAAKELMQPHTACQYLQLMAPAPCTRSMVLRYQQDPKGTAQVRTELDDLKKAAAGDLDLFFPDVTGFALCLSLHTWYRRRQQHRIAHESLPGPAREHVGPPAVPDTASKQPLTLWAALRTWESTDCRGSCAPPLPKDGAPTRGRAGLCLHPPVPRRS